MRISLVSSLLGAIRFQVARAVS